jgi:IS30 family transposase
MINGAINDVTPLAGKTYKQDNYSISKIARVLDFNTSTISRELMCNSKDRYYSPEYAQMQTTSRDKNKRTNKKLSNKVKLLISKYLKQNWSPEQIAGRLKKDKITIISHKIYIDTYTRTKDMEVSSLNY